MSGKLNFIIIINFDGSLYLFTTRSSDEQFVKTTTSTTTTTYNNNNNNTILLLYCTTRATATLYNFRANPVITPMQTLPPAAVVGRTKSQTVLYGPPLSVLA